MPPSSPPSCPLCGDTVARDHAPFCSRRCQDRDLLNWLGDAYAVPGNPAEDTDLSED